MPRGGKREGSGAKPKWKHGKTTSIRVPIALVEQILEAAYKIDNGISLVSKENSKVIDLSGISIVTVKGKKGVIISDLVKAGYKIEPSKLAAFIEYEDAPLFSLFPKTL